jgi:hypothetical protein
MGQESSNPQGNPLSSAQQRYWVLEQLHPEGGVQNISLGLRFAKTVNPAKIEAAIRDVTGQHKILRACFRSVDGVPLQFFDSSAVVRLRAIDLTSTPDGERHAELDNIVRNEIAMKFDLGQDLPLRSTLVQLGEEGSILLLVVHRIACDRLSLEQIVREVDAHYKARPDVRERDSIQVRQYQVPQYQEIIRKHSLHATDVSYWRQQLSNAPASLDLPTDRHRPALQTFSGASESFLIEGPLIERIRELANNSKATLFETLLAAYAVLLHRYSRQEDFVIGTRVSGRSRPEYAGIVGPLENMLALRVGVSSGMSFTQLLTRVKEVMASILAHEDVPFESVVRELHLDRDMSRHPLSQVALSLDELTDLELGSGVTIFEPMTVCEELDLAVDARDTGRDVELRFSYNTDLFDQATIR